MLASVVPGLRDFRTPFAVGMLWLAVLFLWFGDRFPESTPDSGPLRQAYLAAGAAGATTVLTALAFLGYLVGLAAAFRFPQIELLSRRSKVLVDARTRLVMHASTLLETAQMDARFLVPHPHRLRHSVARLDWIGDLDMHRSLGMLRGVEAETDVLANRLLVANQSIFDQYDKYRAEAEFRTAIFVPGIVLLATACIQLDATGWAALLFVSGLVLLCSIFARGIFAGFAARATLLGAVSEEIISSPALKSGVDDLKAKILEANPRLEKSEVEHRGQPSGRGQESSDDAAGTQSDATR